jgi:hypothetical protein
MVSKKYVDRQLKEIGFKPNGWGRGEVNELPNIILPDEQIFECVNGIYDGGFALLIATDVRVLLIDQKPMNYLTVEDLRFDMINEMDYSHRLLGARISISSGSKTLKFLSYNQPRLRKLIGHVQHSMAEAKKQQSSHDESQVQHLEKINEQLQEYLLEQQKQQTKIQEQLAAGLSGKGQSQQQEFQIPKPVKPSPELADYLFAQSLLAQHQTQAQSTAVAAQAQPAAAQSQPPQIQPEIKVAPTPVETPAQAQKEPEPAGNDLYQEGIKEVFGKHRPQLPHLPSLPNALEINPINIAYSKLPMALRNRDFGRNKTGAGSSDEATMPQTNYASFADQSTPS